MAPGASWFFSAHRGQAGLYRGVERWEGGGGVLLTSLRHQRSQEGPHEELLLVVVDACQRERTHFRPRSGGSHRTEIPAPGPGSDNTSHAAEACQSNKGATGTVIETGVGAGDGWILREVRGSLLMGSMRIDCMGVGVRMMEDFGVVT